MKSLLLLLLAITTAAAAPLDDLTKSTATFHGHTEHRFALGDGTPLQTRPTKKFRPRQPLGPARPLLGALSPQSRHRPPRPRLPPRLLRRRPPLRQRHPPSTAGTASTKPPPPQLGLHIKVTVEGLSRGGPPHLPLGLEKTPKKLPASTPTPPSAPSFSWPVENQRPRQRHRPRPAQSLQPTPPSNRSVKTRPPHAPSTKAVLKPLAEHKIPILIVAGLADKVRPLREKRRRRRRHLQIPRRAPIKTITKPGIGHHHPHALDDPTPIVDFITSHTQKPPPNIPPNSFFSTA